MFHTYCHNVYYIYIFKNQSVYLELTNIKKISSLFRSYILWWFPPPHWPPAKGFFRSGGGFYQCNAHKDKLESRFDDPCCLIRVINGGMLFYIQSMYVVTILNIL